MHSTGWNIKRTAMAFSISLFSKRIPPLDITGSSGGEPLTARGNAGVGVILQKSIADKNQEMTGEEGDGLTHWRRTWPATTTALLWPQGQLLRGSRLRACRRVSEFANPNCRMPERFGKGAKTHTLTGRTCSQSVVEVPHLKPWRCAGMITQVVVMMTTRQRCR